MKVIACLCWYDEPVEALRRCILSGAGFVDHWVAVDGRYEMFPGEEVSSDPAQIAAIRSAAQEVGVGCDIMVTVPGVPWGSQAEKRTAMFRMAERAGTPYEDWCLWTDADFEYVVEEGAHEKLAEFGQMSMNSLRFPVRLAQAKRDLSEVDLSGTDMGSRDCAFLIRLHRDMRVEPPSHWWLTGVTASGMREPLFTSEARFPSLSAVHYALERTDERFVAKADYTRARKAAGVDLGGDTS